MKKSIIVSAIATLIVPVFAQDPSVFGKPTTNQPATNTTTTAQDTHTTGPSQKKNSPYGQEIPIFEPESEQIQFMGQNVDLKGSRLAGQFRAYLVMDEEKIEEAAKYRKVMREILDTADPTNNSLKTSQKLTKIAKLLEDAAEYPSDDKISESLRNAMTFARLSMMSSEKSSAHILKLKAEHKRLLNNMKLIETKPDFGSSATKVGQGKDTKANRRAQNSLSVEAIEMKRQMAEKLAQIKKTDLEGDVAVKLAKIQFQANLMQYFAQRRFEHVVLGCRVYTLLFSDGEQKLNIQKGSDVDKFFRESLGVSPTIAGLDSAANEFIGKAKDTASSVRNHMRKKQVHAGTQRMIEAFFLGEHLTPIHTFSLDLREEIDTYIQNSEQLRDAVNVKNWQEAEKYVDKLKDQATDFRYIKAETAIKGYKKASNLELHQFEIAMGRKDNAAARVHMAEALDFWPNNPRIEDVDNEIYAKLKDKKRQQEGLEKTRREFETVKRTKSYRDVGVEDALKYVYAFKQAKTAPELSEADRDVYAKYFTEASDILKNIKAVEEAIKRADAMVEESQHYAAWEAIKFEQEKDYLDKTRLNEKLIQLSDKASKFKQLFEDAEEYLKDQNYGSALSCYHTAKSLHPKSKLASNGIQAIYEKLEN